jgi:hypothetical protein
MYVVAFVNRVHPNPKACDQLMATPQRKEVLRDAGMRNVAFQIHRPCVSDAAAILPWKASL